MKQVSRISDFVFINPGFGDFISIARQINSGSQITIVLENDLSREDVFYTTQFYPFSFFHLKKNGEKLKIWQQFVELAPHLARSEKVFYASYSQLDKWRSVVADYWYKNTYQKKSQIIAKSLRSIFSGLNNIASEGVYFQEYTFNISRFYIEMLKYFTKNGASVFVNQRVDVKNGMVDFKDSGEKIQAKHIRDGENLLKTGYRVSIEIPGGFVMVVRHSYGNFRCLEKKGFLEIYPLSAAAESCSEKKIKAVIAHYFNVHSEKMKMEKKQYLHFPEQLVFLLPPLLKKPLPCTFGGQSFDDMFELCREKFDLAKQCGINFPEFRVLFHRYGKGIDEMIEMAYEKRSRKKEPDPAWNTVENDFQKMHEWKI